MFDCQCYPSNKLLSVGVGSVGILGLFGVEQSSAGCIAAKLTLGSLNITTGVVTLCWRRTSRNTPTETI